MQQVPCTIAATAFLSGNLKRCNKGPQDCLALQPCQKCTLYNKQSVPGPKPYQQSLSEHGHRRDSNQPLDQFIKTHLNGPGWMLPFLRHAGNSLKSLHGAVHCHFTPASLSHSAVHFCKTQLHCWHCNKCKSSSKLERCRYFKFQQVLFSGTKADGALNLLLKTTSE